MHNTPSYQIGPLPGPPFGVELNPMVIQEIKILLESWQSIQLTFNILHQSL